MSNNHTETMSDIQRRCLTDSRYWFPRWEHGSLDERIHQALSIAGEAGEVVEHIKKEHRGDGLDLFELGRELADVTIYVMNLAESVGIDLEAAIAEKRQLNVHRWGEPT